MRTNKLLQGTAVATLLVCLAGGIPAHAQGGQFDGFYVGGHAGYGEANYDGKFQRTEFFLNPNQLDLNGFAGGIHVGYNHLMPDAMGAGNTILFGIEADITFPLWSDRKTGPTFLTTAFIAGDVDLLASVRGRLGVATDDMLFYATAGVAFVDADFEAHYGGTTQTIGLGAVGGVFGGGVEFAVNDMWSVRGEGLYYIFDKQKSIGPAVGLAGDHVEFDDAFVIRAGLSFNLGQN